MSGHRATPDRREPGLGVGVVLSALLAVAALAAGCGLDQEAVLARTDVVEVRAGDGISINVLDNDLAGPSAQLTDVAPPAGFAGRLDHDRSGTISVSVEPDAPPAEYTVVYAMASGGVVDDGTLVVRVLAGEARPPTEVVVGSYIGLEAEEGQRAAAADGFRTRGSSVTVTDPALDGVVVAQRPAPGSSAEPGTVVAIDIGAFERAPAVKVVVGTYLSVGVDEAERDIRLLGLVPVVELVPVQQARDEGFVVVQDPAPGTQVDPGSTVFLSVGTLLRVPDVVGLTEGEALSQLHDVQRAVGQDPSNFDDRVCESANAGRVIAQRPQAGTEVTGPFDVLIVIAADCRPVPDLVGLRLSEAAATLKAWAVDGRTYSWFSSCSSPTDPRAARLTIDRVDPTAQTVAAQFSLSCVVLR